MDDKKLTERESIELITSMIARTKQRYMLGDGKIMLMWGYLTVAVSALVCVLLVMTHNPAWNWLWFLIWIIGGTVTPIMAKKQQKVEGAKSYTDKCVSRLWTIVGYSAIASTALCLGFTLIKGIDAWSMMFAFALIIVPFAEIGQGILINEKSLIAGGGIGLLAGIFTMCCIAGHVVLYVNWYLPVFLFAFICMMIIPGHILNHKEKQQK